MEFLLKCLLLSRIIGAETDTASGVKYESPNEYSDNFEPAETDSHKSEAYFSGLKEFTAEDLNSEDTFLVFIYFEKEGFRCKSCEHYKMYLQKLTVPVLRLNIFTNTKLGSRFMQSSFPACILRSNHRSYEIHSRDGDELLKKVESSAWKQQRPVRPSLDIDSTFAILFSHINPVIMRVVHSLKAAADYIPGCIVHAMIYLVIMYLVYSIVGMFKQNADISKKND
ncbi:hypothetical protein ENBRE01_0522 [Enteropsectra breve]|nr:hypothetical protein ENBRE01_0522 [Enteropsectra breve]